jgi:hypothetical protein
MMITQACTCPSQILQLPSPLLFTIVPSTYIMASSWMRPVSIIMQAALQARGTHTWPMITLVDSLRWQQTAKVSKCESAVSGKDRSCCHLGCVRCRRSAGVRAVTTPASVSNDTAVLVSMAPKGPTLLPGKLRFLASITCTCMQLS